MADPADKRWTVEEFLTWDDGTDRRYELVGGAIVAMAPPSEAHAAIVTNLAISIGNQLRPPCRALAKFGVRLPDRDDSFYQFDLAVSCVDPARRTTVAASSTTIASCRQSMKSSWWRARSAVSSTGAATAAGGW